VRWACPAIETVLPDFRANLSLAVLHDLLNPKTVIKARRTTLLGFIAAYASGNHPHSGRFIDMLVDGLKAAAIEPRRLHGNAVDLKHPQFDHRDRSYGLLESQLGKLGREIEFLYGRLYLSNAPRTIPGTGFVALLVVGGRLTFCRLATALQLLRAVPEHQFVGRRRSTSPKHHTVRRQPHQARTLSRRRCRMPDRSRLG
jgi:hypothetical protein